MHGRAVALEPLDWSHHAAPLWDALRGHDALWAWMGQGPYRDAREMAAGQQQWSRANSAVPFAIVPQETGRPAGWACYMRIDQANGVIEVGNVMYSPSLQRTLAATEAMFLMARHIFEDLGYRRYEWKCNALNEASRRAALRLGFTFEGIFRQHMVVKGANRDTAWFAMLDSEWPVRKAAFEAWIAPSNFDAAGRQCRSLAHIAQAIANAG